ncbi:MAG: methyltransferase domain-containing protein [Caldilineaceae bacterium]
MLDLGCGLGADMLRCAQLGYQPHGLDLEANAVNFVQTQYGLPAQQHDFGQPLPYAAATFTWYSPALRSITCILRQRAMFGEIRRVLQPGGKLLFVVNSETHRQLGLQYDYTDAIELEPQCGICHMIKCVHFSFTHLPWRENYWTRVGSGTI